MLISKLALDESTIGSLVAKVLESILFKAEVEPIIELLAVKSKLLFSISTFGSAVRKAPASKLKLAPVELSSTIWALSAVSMIGEEAWYSPYWASVVLLLAKISRSEVALVVPKSTWAFVSKFIFVSIWVEAVKSTFPVDDVVVGYSPTWTLVLSFDDKRLTEAKSFSFSKDWKSVSAFIWVSKPKSLVFASYWPKPSVEVWKASVDEEAAFTLDETGYSP